MRLAWRRQTTQLSLLSAGSIVFLILLFTTGQRHEHIEPLPPIEWRFPSLPFARPISLQNLGVQMTAFDNGRPSDTRLMVLTQTLTFPASNPAAAAAAKMALALPPVDLNAPATSPPTVVTLAPLAQPIPPILPPPAISTPPPTEPLMPAPAFDVAVVPPVAITADHFAPVMLSLAETAVPTKSFFKTGEVKPVLPVAIPAATVPPVATAAPTGWPTWSWAPSHIPTEVPTWPSNIMATKAWSALMAAHNSSEREMIDAAHASVADFEPTLQARILRQLSQGGSKLFSAGLANQLPPGEILDRFEALRQFVKRTSATELQTARLRAQRRAERGYNRLLARQTRHSPLVSAERRFLREFMRDQLAKKREKEIQNHPAEAKKWSWAQHAFVRPMATTPATTRWSYAERKFVSVR